MNPHNEPAKVLRQKVNTQQHHRAHTAPHGKKLMAVLALVCFTGATLGYTTALLIHGPRLWRGGNEIRLDAEPNYIRFDVFLAYWGTDQGTPLWTIAEQDERSCYVEVSSIAAVDNALAACVGRGMRFGPKIPGPKGVQ